MHGIKAEVLSMNRVAADVSPLILHWSVGFFVRVEQKATDANAGSQE
jgi:hypothetical protein